MSESCFRRPHFFFRTTPLCSGAYTVWGKGGNVTSAGWQVTLCDPIKHASSRNGEASCELLYSVYLYIYLYIRTGGYSVVHDIS